MRADKAIETTQVYLKEPCPVLPPDVRDAIQLGIEALKFLQANRLSAWPAKLGLLPGETEE